MKCLSVDTSGAVLSTAILEDGVVLAAFKQNIAKTHSTHIMSAIDVVLEAAKTTVSDLTHLVTTIGPGSFTGIRIGLATIQGLAMPNNLPIIPVSSLNAMAEAYRSLDLPIMPLIDARHERAFGAFYLADTGLIEEELAPLEAFADQAILKAKEKGFDRFICTGDGAHVGRGLESFQEKIEASGIKIAFAEDKTALAEHAAKLAYRLLISDPSVAIDASDLRPSYLTRTSAEKQLGIEV